jgi:hypothetical protein
MAETAGGAAPGDQAFTILTVAGCIAGAYVFMGAPGLQPVLAAAGAPAFPAYQYWLMAMHLLATAGALSGGLWAVGLMRTLPKPGIFPLLAFSGFQFFTLLAALSNIALGVNMIRFQEGGALVGLALFAPAIAAIRLHAAMYMGLLRIGSWVQTAGVSTLPPLRGAAFVALTVAVNLVPLALAFQSMTTHMIAVLSVLFRRAVVEPDWYFTAIGQGVATVSSQEAAMAGGAGALALLLAALWAGGRITQQRQQQKAEALAGQLSAADTAFVADALPATISAVSARASSSRHVIWAFVWFLAVTPALLAGAYWFYLACDGLLGQYALSWVSSTTSDFENFAVTDQGYARYLVPAAMAGLAVFMSRAVLLTLMPEARFDIVAFGTDLASVMRAALLQRTAMGEIGPGRPFDAAAFVDETVRPRTWPGAAIAIALCLAAGAAAAYDLGRSVVFTADGVVTRAHLLARPMLTRYEMVQAVAIDCRIDALGAKPVYELTLPNARVLDMVGAARLDERLDQYLNADRRLRFSGVGYAYPPGDLTPCLKAIEEQYNPVIAAGAARLLHVVD